MIDRCKVISNRYHLFSFFTVDGFCDCKIQKLCTVTVVRLLLTDVQVSTYAFRFQFRKVGEIQGVGYVDRYK